MSLTVNLYYTGKNGNARKFAQEMESSGLAGKIRQEPGNEKYEYFFPMDDPETVLLIDSWTDQAAIDAHHQTSMMQELAKLREKYDLHMKIERYVSNDVPEADKKFLRK
ncbi:putative quinol monooxygenase [Lactobacillus kalixensis]|uniref:Antibiotic biosynthesis monooxygenase n=1 Tax=Lactobacillus kalixensis DSM 16043 TaxID=1423763 RepID=A0A0R1UIM6_9LACO|nr:putative quinol monooxygenase [Lactobacillus kalixensis]KRL91059.1 antibiotic biosynthesis monooxygenase [Lactobacillus kalixensis DSM 16043]